MGVYMKENGQLKKGAGLYKVSVPVGLADIYSTEEKEVGVWVDGKPLYQKSYVYNNTSGITTTTNLIEISTDFEVYDIEGVLIYQDGRSYPLPYPNGNRTTTLITYFENSKQYIRVVINNDSWSDLYTPWIITIQYTKTTDVPGSGEYVPSGDKAVHYSADEHIVGTWTDGSTLYERTIIAQSIADGTTYVLPNTNIKIRQCDGVFRFRSSGNTLSLYSREYDATYRAILNGYGVDTNGTYMDCSIGTSRTGNLDLEVTIRYTKTTS